MNIIYEDAARTSENTVFSYSKTNVWMLFNEILFVLEIIINVQIYSVRKMQGFCY